MRVRDGFSSGTRKARHPVELRGWQSGHSANGRVRYNTGSTLSGQGDCRLGQQVFSMEIRISKESDVPVRQQLAEQIVFLIATDQLKAGQPLPSVRELARRLKIHHNTVSHAYQELVRRTWLVRRRGTRVAVRSLAELKRSAAFPDLDELINTLVAVARERGLSLQSLRERLRRRLEAEPPDHLLVVDPDPGLRLLLREEIQEAVPWPVESCSPEELATNPGLAIGAFVVAPQYALDHAAPLVSKEHATAAIAFNSADEHLERIRRLAEPSVVAVVSVSQTFLRTARSLLAPTLGRRHTLCEFLLPLESTEALRGADIIFCDSIALREVKDRKAVHYRLVAPESLRHLANAVRSFAAG
jgi:GntR family transcriptional regulator